MPKTRYELHAREDVARISNGEAAGLKEFGAREIDPHFDIPPHLMGFRGKDQEHGLLIELVCGEVDRDKGLEAVYYLAAMDCVAIAATFDAHITTAENNPRTGKPWGPHEMQNLCNGEGACDAGLLTDCLMTTAVFADDTVAGFNRPYHTHEAKREIGWLNEGEVMTGTKDHQIKGVIVDTMRDLMREGRARSALLFSGDLTEMLGIEMPVEARAHRDAVLIRELAKQGAVVRIAQQMAETPREREIIQCAVDENKNISWLL